MQPYRRKAREREQDRAGILESAGFPFIELPHFFAADREDVRALGLVGQANPDLIKYAVADLIAVILLLYRYLKFFRQYSYEMFNAYGRAK